MTEKFSWIVKNEEKFLKNYARTNNENEINFGK